MSGRILVVDDDDAMGALLVASLPKRGYQTRAVTSAEQALALLAEEDFDAVVADLNMKGMNGLQLCSRIVASRPDVPVIVITAFGSLETAIEAIRAGAYDFLTKPFDTRSLAVALDRAVAHRTLGQEVRRLRARIDHERPLHELSGDSPAMQPIRDLIVRLADSEASVLVTGESGTGKEIVSRALHTTSRRAHGPFVAVHCAALPETLLESELFGHTKGAFTDAKAPRTGLFVQANGGTLFLDEIGDMPMSLQVKLLRALQERTIRPVGANSETPIDVRLVCATNRDLLTAIEEKRFREDLFFRINVIEVALPPLRVRGNDVLLLAQQFLREFARQERRTITSISSAAAEKLLAYSWPGNVRELQNVIERAVALAGSEEITIDDLPDNIRQYRRDDVMAEGADPSELVPLEQVERRYILRVLEAVGDSRTQAARILGIDRKTLYRKLELWGYQASDPDA